MSLGLISNLEFLKEMIPSYGTSLGYEVGNVFIRVCDSCELNQFKIQMINDYQSFNQELKDDLIAFVNGTYTYGSEREREVEEILDKFCPFETLLTMALDYISESNPQQLNEIYDELQQAITLREESIREEKERFREEEE